MKTLSSLCLACLVACLSGCDAGTSEENMSTKTISGSTSPAARVNAAVVHTAAGELTIQPINRSSVRFEFQGRQLYVDPSGEADWGRMPRADFIFVTHEHGDHLDVKAISKIAGPETVFYANEASVRKIESDADKPANLPKVLPIAVGERKGFGFGAVTIIENVVSGLDIYVEAVAAYNVSEERKNFHPRSRGDNGYVLTFGDKRVYVAGDTEQTPEMEALAETLDVAMLPCDPRYTMSVEEAVAAARMLKPKIFYPIHQGTSDPNDAKKLLADEDIDVRVYALP